jgi:CheY-like chemotaxis protein
LHGVKFSRIDGKEVLQTIRSHRDREKIPVVIPTASSCEGVFWKRITTMPTVT